MYFASKSTKLRFPALPKEPPAVLARPPAIQNPPLPQKCVALDPGVPLSLPLRHHPLLLPDNQLLHSISQCDRPPSLAQPGEAGQKVKT